MGRLSVTIRRTLMDIGRQAGPTLITISTVAVVFWLLGLLGLVQANLQRLASDLEAGFRLSVFLREDCADACRGRLLPEALALSGTESLEFVGREQAWSRYRGGGGRELERLLEENPFPDTVEVKPRRGSPAELQRLAQELSALEGVEEVVYGQAWLLQFERFKSLLRWLGLVLGAMVFLASAVIISNTARMLVLARREEIEIMELVGASRLFISGPFYLQGTLMGLAGAASGLGLTWLVLRLAAPWLEALSEGALRPEFLSPAWVQLLLGCGAFLGLSGTAFAVHRYLKI